MTFYEQFSHFCTEREAVHQYYRANEDQVVAHLLAYIRHLSQEDITKTARQYIERVRKQRLTSFGLDAFFIQYDLSSEEGIALMCLAEAMLRIPDKDNMDALIKDKLLDLHWGEHKHASESWLVNAATWGLVVTDKLYGGANQARKRAATLKQLVGRLGEPVVRQSVKQAMGMLGEQFILGKTIQQAIARATKKANQRYYYSYDMLGEAAKTHADAEAYFKAYKDSIAALHSSDHSVPLLSRPGISIKLSALHPRYELAQFAQCVPAITDKLLTLVRLAQDAHISVTLDAEEADRLELSLAVFAEVFREPDIHEWEGFGLAVQAYQKRATWLLEYLAKLAKRYESKILIRLVKGAYWDTEIKQSQVMGYEDYPVFTRKFNTDVSYLACAEIIAANENSFYGQFATHNAHTVAAILQIYGDRTDFEFQCLHGMGRSLYDAILTESEGLQCRMYAPVGDHEALLPYLVRRLLENGANTSFVNRIIDKKVPIDSLLVNPIKLVQSCESAYHPYIPLPQQLFGLERKNSFGYDLRDSVVVSSLAQAMDQALVLPMTVYPLVDVPQKILNDLVSVPVTRPADRHQQLGVYHEVNANVVAYAIDRAAQARYEWAQVPVATRAGYLREVADLLEEQAPAFMALAIEEAGKLWQDAVDEVREAVDFLRYYAARAEQDLETVTLPGPTGELNQLAYHGRGVIFCISPWNFPLAIFCGQIAAAMVSGNTVLAKPAAQTVMIATKCVELFYAVGVPRAVIQLIPGPTDIAGEAVVADNRVDAVMLTGSTATAKAIYQTLADREGAIVPLIAETGGMNAMIVDSTALTEQVVQDVVDSAFRSAGQRCSALRVLYIQEEVADKTIKMLQGAMKTLIVGDSKWLQTDVGPVIDARAAQMLQDHVEYLEGIDATLLYQVPRSAIHKKGTFFMPRAYEIERISALRGEVFGPILHVIRYRHRDLDQVIQDINQTQFGLTFGIHSRVDATAVYIKNRIHAGNVYINRNIIGAVVGVQPFGGEGLSGTGPKAGGPNYLKRLCHERTTSINTAAVGGNTALMTLEDPLLTDTEIGNKPH